MIESLLIESLPNLKLTKQQSESILCKHFKYTKAPSSPKFTNISQEVGFLVGRQMGYEL